MKMTDMSMTGAFKFLLSVALLLAAAQGNQLSAKDAQTCMDLCATCHGNATFENEICKCFVAEDDTKGLECINRLNLEVRDLGVDTASTNVESADRTARCSFLKSRKRIASADIDRIASYFMQGGPVLGTPMLGSTNAACGRSNSNPITGAINLSNAIPRPEVDPSIEENPMIGAPHQAYSSTQYQPIVPSSDAAYSPMIGAPQSYQAAFYPHMFTGAIAPVAMAYPHAVPRTACHNPSHRSKFVGSSQHTPIVSSLASGTHSLLQRLDNTVAPHASERHHNKIVGASQRQRSDCSHSFEPSYSTSSAPAPFARTQPDQISASQLRQVLAHQNSMLQALSQELKSLGPQARASRTQYAPVVPVQYMLGAPQQMMGQCAPQQMMSRNAPQQMMGQPEPQQMMGQYAPQQMMGRNAPQQMMGQPEPQQMMGQYAPQQMMGRNAPQQMMGQPEPQQMMGQYAPQQMMGRNAPQQMMGQPEPQQMIGQCAPQQMMGQHAPQQMMGRNAQQQMMGQPEPQQMIGQCAPQQMMGRNAQQQMIGQPEPERMVGQHAPQPTSESPAEASPKKTKTVAAPKQSSSGEDTNGEDSKDDPSKDEDSAEDKVKSNVSAKKAKQEESQTNKPETRTSSASKKKPGDVKNAKKSKQ